MAHHKSAQKRIRQTERRTEDNRERKLKVRASVKKTELAITAGKHKDASEALKAAQKALATGVSKGVVTKGAAARKTSRLNAKVKALATKK